MTLQHLDFANANPAGVTGAVVTTADTTGKIGIVTASGAARSDTTSLSYALFTTAPGSVDQFAQATFVGNVNNTSVSVGNTGVGVCLVNTAGVITGYAARHTGGQVGIIRLNADGTVTELSRVENTRIIGQVLRLVREGNTLKMYLNGTQVGPTVTDATFVRVGQAGIRLSSATGAALDEFYYGTLTELSGAPTGVASAAPPQVLNGSASVVDDLVLLTWGPAASATSYRADYRKIGDTTWIPLPVVTDAATSVTLTPGNYEFSFVAINSFGTGTRSTVVGPVTVAGDEIRELNVPLLDVYDKLLPRHMPAGYDDLVDQSVIEALRTLIQSNRGDLTMRSLNERQAVPTMTRLAKSVATRAQVGLPTIYIPWMIKVPDAVFAAYPNLGRWRIYTSTDHDPGTGAGGIAVIYTNALDPTADDTVWSFYRTPGGDASVFTEGASTQTETPTVVYNPRTSLFHMLYQIRNGSLQRTRVATSVDGVTNWTVVGDAIPNLPSNVAGYNHTGYAKLWYIDGLWCAYHLMGSGVGTSDYGWSYSYDGLSFITNREAMTADLQDTDGVLRLGISGLFEFRGQRWAIGTFSEYTSGTQSSTVRPIWCAPINDDLRSLRGRPQLMSVNLVPGDDPLMLAPPSQWTTLPDGRLVGAYRVEGNTSSTDFIRLAVLSS
jgi:hypothetical protein